MNNLKKVLAAVLCLAMILSLSACGGNGAPSGDNTAPEITGVFDNDETLTQEKILYYATGGDKHTA